MLARGYADYPVVATGLPVLGRRSRQLGDTHNAWCSLDRHYNIPACGEGKDRGNFQNKFLPQYPGTSIRVEAALYRVR